MKTRITSLILLSLGGATGAWAAQGSQADYDRSAQLRSKTRNKVFKERVETAWSPEGKHLWYRVRVAPDRYEYRSVETASGERRQAFDPGRLSAALAEAGIRGVRPDRLPIHQFHPNDDGNSVTIRIRNGWWEWDEAQGKLEKSEGPERKGGRERLVGMEGAPRRSRSSSTRTGVTFQNTLEDTVELFWLDTRGRRKSYGKVEAGASRFMQTYSGHVWLVVGQEGKPLGVHEARVGTASVEITSVPKKGGAKTSEVRRRASSRSPDGRWTAFLRDHNVFVRTKQGEETRLSREGTGEDPYSGSFYWSPDSKRLVALQVRPAQKRTVHFVESSPRDQVQPKLHSFNYLKPGDRLAVPKPHLFDVETGKQIPVSNELFENPWRIRDIRWAEDSSRFTFIYNQRGHQVLRVLAVDARNGSVRVIVDEKSETFIHYSGKFFLRWLEGTGELLWMSERDGWNHLYLYDAVAGKVKNQITKGTWLVRRVDRVDVEARQVWFQAGGIHPDQDPYHVHHARVNFDGSGLTLLTEGDGTHEIAFSPDRRSFIDRYSRVDLPPVTELRRTSDGALVSELEKADWRPLLETGWKPPIRFVAKGRDGETDIHGVIFRPTTFDDTKKYPVVEEIYAGPHGSFVPKSFGAYHGPQGMAELGFILVQIDGMGTNNRSKKFHDVCFKNLKDAGLPDRMVWLKAAAARYPYMDLNRVGIYGNSAGGQSTAAALMQYGDFYKVGVAVCGCHDNRMDKIWWNEQWMGWPVGPEYASNSNVTMAKNLKGKLLLIVGELDRNVDPASTMQVVNALIKADKDFDMLVIPGGGHGAGRYGTRRRADYFVRHLLGVEPRHRP